ncbi:polyphosphate kinase 2 family protein [Danxiaibacter flavus]|uniref:Polyphosphate kinase 2 family protein n=1 Tax=Danxiaibacter flavus TaxID=3049108 RepID=A0ABV3ZHW7_9BACT|nr:polyphosphate kinase 2 family protein [Chitinophagaceae bacterium DXS]
MKSKEKELDKIDVTKLSKKELIQRAKKFSKNFCVSDGKNFRLKDYDPDDDGGLGPEDKPLVKQVLQLGVNALATMQDILYAQDRWSVLLIFQAMDAAGKDGAIKHVMSGINPQGCQVSSFKAPTSEDLDHDYMWRCMRNLPERGRIGIFNRSYYEEVLVVRVHEQLLQSQKIPQKLVTKNIWKERFEDIRNIEKYLTRNGTLVCKFFLNVSAKEQKKRFLERIDNPDKNWKFSASDAKERRYWKEYMNAYEDMIKNTATKDSPWYVIPADNKAFSRVAVASAVIETLDSIGLEYPKVAKEKLAELGTIKQELLAEK